MVQTGSSNDMALRQIGFRLSVPGESSEPRAALADIEETLLDVIARFPEDFRLSSMLLSWVKVHGGCVIVEKLGKLARKREATISENTVWLSAAAAWAVVCGHHKWRKLIRKATPPLCLPPREVTESAVARKGAEPWLAEWGFVAPRGMFRIRERDVLTPEELSARHPQYRSRYILGLSSTAPSANCVSPDAKGSIRLSGARRLRWRVPISHRLQTRIP